MACVPEHYRCMQRKYAGAAICAIALSLFSFAAYRYTANFIVAQQRAELDAKWMAVKGYLRIESYGPDWFYDSYDPEEARIVEHLRRIFALADANGKLLRASAAYERVGLRPLSERQTEMSTLTDFKAAYRRADSTLLRTGVLRARDGAPYYMSIGEDTGPADAALRTLRLLLAAGVFVLTGLYVALSRWAAGGTTLRTT